MVEVQSGGLEKYGFTGQENDADTELMYYGARYYSPEYRVFVQPDSIIANPYNPQALNRYAYALNNPVKYNDPSGHYVETALDLAFIAQDVVEISNNPSDAWAWAALGADVACAVLPVATGGGLAVKALEETVAHGDDALKLGKAASNLVESADTIGDSVSLVGKYGDDTGEALAKMSSEVESMGIVGKNAGATGTLKHSAFKEMGEEWAAETGKSNVFFEQSINNMGDFANGNPQGSVRLDSVEFMSGGLVDVYDLKTGNAKLSNPQMNRVAANLFNNNNYNTLRFHEVKNGQTTLLRTMTRE